MMKQRGYVNVRFDASTFSAAEREFRTLVGKTFRYARLDVILTEAQVELRLVRGVPRSRGPRFISFRAFRGQMRRRRLQPAGNVA